MADPFSLLDAPLDHLLLEFGRALTHQPSDARVGRFAEMAVDEVVRLTREGSRAEVLRASDALATFLARPEIRTAESHAEAPLGVLHGLLPVLVAGSSASSKGGKTLVLRSWGGKAQRLLEQLARAGGTAPRAELRSKLDISESHISHLLGDMEDASLVERLGLPGRRSVDVHLTSQGRELVPLVTPPKPVGPFRTVTPPKAHDLTARLQAADLPGGPIERFRPRHAA